MNKKTILRHFFLPVLILGFMSSCSEGPESGNNFQRKDIELTRAEENIAYNQYVFSVDLLKSTYEVSKDKNVLISPLSISMILGQMTSGIDEVYRDEIYKILKISKEELEDYHGYSKKLLEELPVMDPNSVLKMNNGFWMQRRGCLSNEYESLLKDNYKSAIDIFEMFDQSTVNNINSWIKEKTNGDITGLLIQEDLLLDIDYVWANTLYFKGTWRQQFDKSRTSAQPFYPSYPDQSDNINVQMMKGFDFRYSYSHTATGEPLENIEDAIQTAILPYGNESFIFTAVLPSKNNPDISSTLETLTPEYWEKIDRICATPKAAGDLIVNLPKMQLNQTTEFIPVLKNMGVERIFNKITVKDNLGFNEDNHSIKILRQNLIFDQDEEGAVLIAASVGGGGMSYAVLPELIIFDRPFIYFIRERSTGAVLLAGVYSHP